MNIVVHVLEQQIKYRQAVDELVSIDGGLAPAIPSR
jgi:hypothetical protein